MLYPRKQSMMKGNDDLFQLIKSMSKSEKRYFKLDAQKSSTAKTNKVKLFDAINAMEVYTEEKLKKKVFVKHLSKEKIDLYDSILKSMRNYRSEKSIYAQIKERMMDSDYLYELGLHKQSRKMLMKAKKLAQEVEHHIALLEINRQERTFIRRNRGKEYLKEIKSLIKEKDNWLSTLLEEFKSLDHYDNIFEPFFKNYNLKNVESLDAFKKTFPLVIHEEEINSFQVKRRLHKSIDIYNILTGNIHKVYESSSNLIQTWNDYPKIKKEEFHHYIGDLANLIAVCFTYEIYKKIPKLIKELKANSPKHFHEQRLLFFNYTLYMLNYNMNTCQFDKAILMVPEIENGIKYYNLNPNQELVLLGNINILFFVTEKYEKFIIWVTKMLSSYKTSNRQDIQQAFRILKLIALIEIDDLDKLENEFRATKRFFEKHTSLNNNDYEWIALGYLKKLSVSVPSIQKKLLQEFHRRLQKLYSFHKKTTSVGLEELFLWVSSKLSNQSIISYMTENDYCK